MKEKELSRFVVVMQAKKNCQFGNAKTKNVARIERLYIPRNKLKLYNELRATISGLQIEDC